MTQQYSPPGAHGTFSSGLMVPVGNSSGDVAAATATATLPAASGVTTYIEGFDLTGGGATGAGVIVGTITGLQTQTGTLTFDVAIAAGATAPMNAQGGLFVRFPTPIPASAPNTAIVVSFPTFGAGNLHACVTAYGFQA